MLVVYMVGIAALESQHSLAAHLGVQIAVFAVVLPHARPARVAAEVHHGSIGPRNASGLGFIGRDAGAFARQSAVEGGSHVDALGEERASLRVGRAVNLVHAVDAGDAHRLHRLLLDAADDLLPLLRRLRHAGGYVENRADLVGADDRVEHRFVELETVGVFDGHDAHVDRHHRLPRKVGAEVELGRNAVFFEQPFDIGLRRSLRIDSGKGIDALLEQVDREFAHLAHLLVERHLAQLFFDLAFDLFVARNRRSGSRKRRRDQERSDGAKQKQGSFHCPIIQIGVIKVTFFRLLGAVSGVFPYRSGHPRRTDARW